MKTMQNGGRTISEKAAERKSGKGKGLYVSSTSSYIPYTKAGQKEVKETGGTEVYNLKPERKVMKKMAVGGTTTKRIIKKSTGGMYGIPQENLGTSGQYGFAKKGGSTGTHKMPNGKTMLNSKMQNGGVTRPMAPIAPTVRPMRNDPKKCIGSPPGYVWNERLGGCIAPARSPSPVRSPSPSRVPANSIMKKGGATKAAKFAALAPPYNKATFADKIVGAKKSAGSKKLPKAQLGGLLKGVSKISKIIKPATKTVKKVKIIKPAAKVVKPAKSKSRIPGVADNLKFMAKNIGAGGILAIPPYLGLVAAAKYYRDRDNKNKNAVNKNKVKVNANKVKVKTKKK